MKKVLVVLLLQVTISLLTLSMVSAVEDIAIVKGSSQVMKVDYPQKIVIGDDKIASVKEITPNKEVLITGRKEGTTSLMIWDKEGKKREWQIVVLGYNPKELLRIVKKLIKGIEGVTTRIEGSKVYLEGETLTQEDTERIKGIVRQYKQIEDLTRISPRQQEMLAMKIQGAIGIPGVQVRAEAGRIFLTGSVTDKSDLEQAEKIAKAYTENILNLLTVSEEEMVQIDVKVLNVSKSAGRQIRNQFFEKGKGLSLGITYDSTTTSPGDARSTFAMSTAIRPVIEAMIEKGEGRILAKPRLVVKNGGKASFLAGGEFPIAVVQYEKSIIEWKQYGVSLEIEPTIDKEENIDLHLTTEVSNIDEGLEVQGYPGMLTRKIETQVKVKPGYTLVIAGLLQIEKGKTISRFPILGYIPVLGALFRSSKTVERETELIILVSPSIVKAEKAEVVKGEVDLLREEVK